MQNEIDTEPILRKMFEDGKRVFVPRYSKSGMEMVKLHSMEDWENLPLTKWDIKQPYLKDNRENALGCRAGSDCKTGVAFTKDGLRLGHGGGYYDRYMKNIKELQSVSPSLSGVAFKEQVVNNLPTEDTDVKIDKVLYAD
ncbi:hypothetical protein NQ317_010370 [Molorchus minor]|uniref:5-formyltetrahydrofolate cyclo-ligase n=1 Tax=Molorchus minor TaxID=1323400 RepID=A0ABQ9JGI5_9CUCU|nr:hypothetical protein NQ317_010370 [Molorchus minor]